MGGGGGRYLGSNHYAQICVNDAPSWGLTHEITDTCLNPNAYYLTQLTLKCIQCIRWTAVGVTE